VGARGDYQDSEVQQLLNCPDFNRRTFDRGRIGAILMREAVSVWTTSPA